MNIPFNEDSQKILISLQNPHMPIDVSVHKQQNNDKQMSQILEVLECEYKYSETEEETKQKDEKLKQLRQIIRDWIQAIAEPIIVQTTFTGELLFFGSYKLKVNSHDSDIDTVCLVPYFVDRDTHFFGELVNILQNRKEVTEIFPIKEASVPIIKMKFSGILFDLSFARAPPQYNGENIDLTSNQMLLSMDERSYRSFNGCRVAEWLIRKENISNYENFKITLKCIKLWATNRGIYSNIIGYLSGIGWTILVAKICQLYPNYPPNQLIERFFFLYSHWKWHDLPVYVEHIQEDVANTKLNADQWRPEFRDRNSMMIITPCFPCMNCAHNVSPTTLRIIQEQLQYGNRIINKIKKNEKSYSDLFKPFNFFKRYKHFIQINIVATNKNDHIVWKGHVESRIRKLTKIFESCINNKLIEVHPYPNPFEYSPKEDDNGEQDKTQKKTKGEDVDNEDEEDDNDDDDDEDEDDGEDSNEDGDEEEGGNIYCGDESFTNDQFNDETQNRKQTNNGGDETNINLSNGEKLSNPAQPNINGSKDQQNNSNNEQQSNKNGTNKHQNSSNDQKGQRQQKSKYKYRCTYFYGIRCISNDKSEYSSEIDLKDPIIKFVEQLEMPPMNKIPETMNIYFRHILRNQIKFRQKDIQQFQSKKSSTQKQDLSKVFDSNKPKHNTSPNLDEQVKPKWAQIKYKNQVQIIPDFPQQSQ